MLSTHFMVAAFGATLTESSPYRAASSFLSFLARFLDDLLSGPGVLVLWMVVLLSWALLWRARSRLRAQERHLRELSSELHGAHVTRGYAGEALAPLLSQFPVTVGRPGTTTLFVGQPVDYLHFDDERGVTFIEIKTGSASLSPRQRRLQRLVEEGAVRWETMYIDSSTKAKS